MKFTQSILPLSLASLALATPTRVLQPRATEICGQWDSVETGTYTVYQDLWGQDNADSGSQCTTVESAGDDGTLSWSTSWTWAGGDGQVKSFANAVVTAAVQQISAITSIPTTWDWR